MFRLFFIVCVLVLVSPFISGANNDQAEFCKINKKYIDLSRKTTKELKLQLYKRKRKKELSNINYDFSNWNGKIEAIEGVGDEYAYVSISICKNVTIKTWNNEFSDMFDKSLIHIDSELYERILDLEKGNYVITSGSFTKSDTDYFQETSITDSGSLTEPEYLVKFIEIGKKE